MINVTTSTIIIMRDRAIEALKASRYGEALSAKQGLIEKLIGIPLSLNYRTRTRGGSCKWKRQAYTRHAYDISIEIGYEYATRATEIELENTVKHELAHAFHILLTHSSDHGSMWQMIHRAMGGTAERCHSVTVRKNIVKRYKIVDNKTGKVYNVTQRKLIALKTWPSVNGVERFSVQGVFTRGGEPQLAQATA